MLPLLIAGIKVVVATKAAITLTEECIKRSEKIMNDHNLVKSKYVIGQTHLTNLNSHQSHAMMALEKEIVKFYAILVGEAAWESMEKRQNYFLIQVLLDCLLQQYQAKHFGTPPCNFGKIIAENLHLEPSEEVSHVIQKALTKLDPQTIEGGCYLVHKFGTPKT